MANERTFSRKEVEDWLNLKVVKETYSMKGHSFVPLKGVGKQYCRCCGLVALNNPISIWCIEMGCNYKDHPQYQNKLSKLAGGQRRKY